MSKILTMKQQSRMSFIFFIRLFPYYCKRENKRNRPVPQALKSGEEYKKQQKVNIFNHFIEFPKTVSKTIAILLYINIETIDACITNNFTCCINIGHQLLKTQLRFSSQFSANYPRKYTNTQRVSKGILFFPCKYSSRQFM